MEDNVSKELSRFRGHKHVERNRIIAKFCRVTNHTASHWGRNWLPRGGALNKLWFFLSANGAKLPELERLHPAVYYIGKLLAYGVIDEEAARELLGCRAHSHLWVLLQGASVPLVVRKGRLTLEQLQQQFEPQLKQARQEAAERGLVTVLKQDTAPTLMLAPKVPTDLPVLAIFAASMISGLKPLLKTVLQDQAGAEALREAVGSENFHDVLDLMKSAASRKAHEFYHGKGGKHVPSQNTAQ